MEKTSKAFTLIELLVSMSVLIILVGAVIGVINPVAQRRKVRDSLRYTNLEKIIVGVEAYASVVGTYPNTGGAITAAPLSTDTALGTYIKVWPNGEPSSGDQYYYYSSTDRSVFGVSITREFASGMCYKYRSDWSNPKIMTCQNISMNCSPSDSGSTHCTL